MSTAAKVFHAPAERKRARPQAHPAITAGMTPDARVKLPQIIGDATTVPPTPGLFPISKSQFYNLVRRGEMPAPSKPFPGCRESYWRLGDVLEAIQRLERAADGAPYETPLVRKRRAAAGGA
ncbi:hypothetical protein [Ferrovum sp.]|uniref:helix-turn-helix transcriptional regulator n=1 Tax=Ferrovum sp. TaxID=2609467 RepID=UPI00260E5A0B|nr:hypothetical protein [Ferrovum sp.]